MKQCAVEMCREPYHAKGYCLRHYAQARSGSVAIDASRSPGREWLRRNMHTLGTTDECQEWPYRLSSVGYAVIQINRTNRQVMHLVLEAQGYPRPEWNGQPAHCLHSCDNRRCINPRHLRWGTHADNMQDAAERDRMKRGTSNKAHRLTETEVQEIRSLLARGAAKRALARRFGVDGKSILNIANGSTWGWLE